MKQQVEQKPPSIDSLVSTNASQAAAIEQSRAVAEVQASVTVAQSVPRNLGRVEAEVAYTCKRMSTASKAFYSMPRAGGRVEGVTVDLARELARIYGNLDYGVRELRRDDNAGESEMQAWAWDMESNTRSTRSFIAPHARMAKGKRQPISDLSDINLNNNNFSARAVRECIFQLLPSWLKDEAESICRETLEQGEGEPLDTTIQKMLGAFKSLNVTEKMIESKLEKPRSAWTSGDVAALKIDYGTLSRQEAKLDELFPPDTSLVDELTGEVQQ